MTPFSLFSLVREHQLQQKNVPFYHKDSHVSLKVIMLAENYFFKGVMNWLFKFYYIVV